MALPGLRHCIRCYMRHDFAGGWETEREAGLCPECKAVTRALAMGTPRDVRRLELETATGRQSRFLIEAPEPL